MKKLILLIVALSITVMVTAQPQQGYMKTKGRMVNGKLVPGQGLKGATRWELSLLPAVYDYVSRQYGGAA